MNAKATMRDVARKSGVSVATVSRVINFPGEVRQETVETVNAAMRVLNYRPNINGRRLKAAQSRSIGVLVPTLSNPVFADSVQGIEQEARAAGLTVLLTASNYNADHEAEAVSTLLDNRVDGLILTVTNADDSPVVRMLTRENIPFVLLYNQPANPDIAAVSVDNAQSAHDMTCHLLAAGHRNFAMVAGRFSSSDRSRQRYEGFARALAGAGIADAPLIEVGFDDTDLENVLTGILRGEKPVTALVCSNDILAITAIGACRKLGLRVPGDVSVAGFDGIAVGGLIQPKLCSVVQPTHEMGRQALALLRGLITGEAKPRSLLLPHYLSEGESIGPSRLVTSCPL